MIKNNTNQNLKLFITFFVGVLFADRESWLVHTLVDYYYVTNSVRAGEILAEVREPQDKVKIIYFIIII